MSGQDQQRLRVLVEVDAGRLTTKTAGELLGITQRHVRRTLARYREEGFMSLVHGNRGRVPWNATPEILSRQVVKLAATKYPEHNYTHLAEQLVADGVDVSVSSVRRFLIRAHKAPKKTRRSPRSRQRRTRSLREGELIQVDASYHDWLGTGQKFTLVAGIDDATGRVWGHFQERENAEGYIQLLRTICSRGTPLALYTDRHGIFGNPNGLRGYESQMQTQVQRILSELGIRHIYARSPQAKGRIERFFKTAQDRLVAVLRAHKVTTMESANRHLANYLRDHSIRFGVRAEDSKPAWLPWPAHLHRQDVFCVREVRQVRNDSAIVLGQEFVDLPPPPRGPASGQTVVVLRPPNQGAMRVMWKGSELVRIPRGRQNPGFLDNLSDSASGHFR